MSREVKAIAEPELSQLYVHMGAIGNSATYQLLSSRWKGESIALRRETGHQTSECKGEKGISASQK